MYYTVGIAGTALTFVLSSFLFALGHLLMLRIYGKQGHFGRELRGYYISLPVSLTKRERYLTAFTGVLVGGLPVFAFAYIHTVGVVLTFLYGVTGIVHMLEID